jgi:septal ring factor EnvC (AmiA/AmiB activator)
MATDAEELLDLSWFHCNECRRSFDNHNRTQLVSGSIRLLKSDLVFAMTSCGHAYCDACIRAHFENGKFTCPRCRLIVHCYRLDTTAIPKKLEAFLKSPMGLLEEAMTVMAFQLNNANDLIKDLRCKISQQKELLTRVKRELDNYKQAKEQIARLLEENETLRQQLSASKRVPDSPAISIRPQQRMSIKSPISVASPSLMSPRYSSDRLSLA